MNGVLLVIAMLAALEANNGENGRYPEKLDALMPGHLNEVLGKARLTLVTSARRFDILYR